MISGARKLLPYAPPPVRRRGTEARTVEAAPPLLAESFINSYVVIDDAQDHGEGGGTMPFALWPAQRDLLGAIEAESRLLILKARQLGISWLVCAYALWLCLYRPGRVVLAFSKGQAEANELLRRVSVMYARLPDDVRAALPALVRENTEEMAWANGSRIKSMPATRSAGRTFTASLAIMDEAAFMQWAAELYTALKPTVDGGGALIVLSTANGRANLFHDLVQRALAGAGRFAFRFLPWTAHPARDAAWYAATEADAVDSAHMKQEYPATPEEAFEATEVDTFLPSIALWDACRAALPPLGRHEPCVLALDAAESNDTFGTVAVSADPGDSAAAAVRYVRGYVPAQGEPLDFDEIEIDVREFVARHAVQAVVYDPMLLGQMMRRLQQPARLARKTTPDVWVDYPALPAPLVPFPQGTQRLEADKGLYDATTQRRIVHDGNPELRQHLANANRKVDGEGRRLRIVKRTYAEKIDLAVATSMGLHHWLALAPLTGWTADALAAFSRERPV
jgi:hypothetical protein